MKARSQRCARLFLMGLLAGVPPARAAQIFVATTGSDATGTGTGTRPFRTVNRALQGAVSGDVVEVRGGVYREAGEVRIRGPGITLRSYPGERAWLQAPVDNEDDYSACIYLDPDADRTTLSGLEISGGYYYGIMLQTKWEWGDPTDNLGACRVTITDCTIHDTGRDAIKITPNCDDIVVRRCEIYRTGIGPANVGAENAEGIDCVNGDRVTVQDCWIHDIFSTGVYLKGGATDGLVERTRVSRCGGGGVLLGFDTSPEYFDLAVNPRYYENIRGTVRNCLIRDTGWEGIGMYAASNPAVYNNTLVNVCTGGIHAALYFGLTYQDWEPGAGRPPSIRPTIRNNLIAQPAGFADEMFEIRYQDDLGGMSALTGWPAMDCNGYSIAGGGTAWFTDRRPGSELDRGTLAHWRAHSGADVRSLTLDPLWAAGGGSNGQLQAASPYVDRGTNAGWMVGATDLQGAPRIANRIVDIGACEQPAVSPPALVLTPTSRFYPAAGAAGPRLAVRANVPWTATSSQAWLTITAGAPGAGDGAVTYTAAPNGGKIRSGRITVSGGGLVRTFTVNQWPAPPVPGVSAAGDFDGDGAADPAIFHPESGTWRIAFGTGGEWRFHLGWAATIPVPADYDGDGLQDFAVFYPRAGDWYVLRSTSGRVHKTHLGWSATTPVPADYDGDGRADEAVFHRTSGRWLVRGTTAGVSGAQWGYAGWTPVPGDYDGDGQADLAARHPSNGDWYLLHSSTGRSTKRHLGWSTTPPVPADFDGDGKTDPAVFHPSAGDWYLIQSSDGNVFRKHLGWATTIPAPGDYDGDGRADLAVYHTYSGDWYIWQSTTGKVQKRRLGGPGWLPIRPNP